jgi:hypothetical protein
MDVSNIRHKPMMEASGLKLGAQKVEKKHELRCHIAWQFVDEFHKTIMVSTIRTLGVAELPTDRRAVGF